MVFVENENPGVVQTFIELVSIPSPSGEEAKVGEYIKERLKKEGIDSDFDGSGSKNDSDSGNLIAKVDGRGPTVMFLTHMDTVEMGRTVPVIDGDTIRTDGNSILGADNKASVAPLMHAIIDAKKLQNRPRIIAAFTTHEENGSMGAKYLDIGEHVDYVFVVDGAKSVGTFITKALGQMPFLVDIYGKEVHAAVNPDKGANAIRAAGLAISKLEIGRADDGSTINVGTISGGTVVNVVPGRVTMKVEVRAYEQKRIQERFESVEREVAEACRKTNCTYTIKTLENDGAAAFSISPSDGIVSLAKRASLKSGLEFSLGALDGTCEANVLVGKFDSIIAMGRGGKMPHSRSESITKMELLQTERLLLEIIKAATDNLQ